MNNNGNADGNLFDSADLIHVYTRENAPDDGVLVDVSDTAREAGINWPVAPTAVAFARYVEVPPGVMCQDEAGRLWDIVYMLSLALRAAARQRPLVARRCLHLRLACQERQSGTVSATGAPESRMRLRRQRRASYHGHDAN